MRKKEGSKNWYTAWVVLLLVGIVGYGFVYYSLKPKSLTEDKRALIEAKNGDYVSSIRQDNLGGEIAGIDKTGRNDNGFIYKVRLTIKVGNIGPISYYLNDADLKLLKILSLVNGKEQPMAFNELKTGDRVVIMVKMNLLKPPDSNLLEFKITKM